MVRDTIKPSTFAGWKAHYQREPWGSEHFYRFLAHAFVLLAQAFHLKERALELRSSDFLWWIPPDEESDEAEADDGMTEEQIAHYAAVLEMRQKILREQAAERAAKREQPGGTA